MTWLLLALGVVLVGVTARTVAQAAALPRLRLKAHISELASYGYRAESPGEESPAPRGLRTILEPLARRIGHRVSVGLPALRQLPVTALGGAGLYDMGAEAFHGIRAVAAGAGALLLTALVVLAGGATSLFGFVVIAAGAVAGWELPAFVVQRRGAERLYEVDHELPELIDLLIATVEAGMGFAAALDLVAGRLRGPLGAELRLAVHSQSLGISSAQALGDMADRCSTISVRAFVRTVVRADSLGTAIGPILRELAVDMRRRRRQAAREKMQKAPVKLIFPLMFLIFPALMIEILYPAAYSLISSLGSL